MPKPKQISNAEAAWTAYENEVQASGWALRSMAEHVTRIETELDNAHGRIEELEQELRAKSEPPPPVKSGVRVRAAPEATNVTKRF
jgi:predicted  nucleic acid-binding Zn-ribbon protein